MLKEILSGKTCAKCRMCCIFDRYDVWETPIFDEMTKNKTLEFNSNAEFVKMQSGGYMLNAGKLADGDLFKCPALTENGCILGDNKPYDCKIWPFRLMKKEGEERRFIAVSTLCEAVHNQDHEKLRQFLEKGLANEIFAYADKNPDIVKPYYDNYTIILHE